MGRTPVKTNEVLKTGGKKEVMIDKLIENVKEAEGEMKWQRYQRKEMRELKRKGVWR